MDGRAAGRRELLTAHGVVRLPAYMPVSTFGEDYPLDGLIRPFLGRFCDAVMVAAHYARQIETRPEGPLFVDSGGFALLIAGSVIEERADGTGAIVRALEQGEDALTPESVLALQARLADFGSTLDFPIPPSLDDAVEVERRVRLTLENARWAMAQPRPSNLRLFGSVQGADRDGYLACASSLISMGFVDLAIGGLVPRLAQKEWVIGLARDIAAIIPEDGLLHAFGVGEPSLARALFDAGVTSVDSSSYVRRAASGETWDGDAGLEEPSAWERAHMALANLKAAVSRSIT